MATKKQRMYNGSEIVSYVALTDVNSAGKPLRNPNGCPGLGYVIRMKEKTLEAHRAYMRLYR